MVALYTYAIHYFPKGFKTYNMKYTILPETTN